MIWLFIAVFVCAIAVGIGYSEWSIRRRDKIRDAMSRRP